MTHHISPGTVVALMDEIAAGATVATACQRYGFTDRTLYRRAKADPQLAAKLEDAIAEREASKERVPHGDPAGSRYARGCRCDLCRDAHRLRVKRRRDARKGNPIPASVVHGRASTYTNWSCRCRPCTDAWTRACKPYRDAWVQRERAKAGAR